MSRFPPNFTPFRRPQARTDAREAMDFLQSTEKLSGLLPTASRLAQLQQACENLQPLAFVHDGLIRGFQRGGHHYGIEQAGLVADAKG